MKKISTLLINLLLISSALIVANASKYKNFKTAVYVHVEEVQQMGDKQWLASSWEQISSQVHVDKIYLETHRDYLIDEATLKKAIKFFKDKGIQVAGGITLTYNEQNLYETFCYTKKDHRASVKKIIEFTASMFDEIILDDFYFTSCKCHECFDAKGNRSWSEYRTKLMAQTASDLIMTSARAVNPKVKVVIKYPNWYDHFQETGFNLKEEPKIFDGIYTGNETRDAVLSNQHLQPYLSYLAYRYFTNTTSPGKNGGGWVDTGGMMNYDRYAEQLWLSILAKTPELTLFNYKELMYPLRDDLVPDWSSQNTSFNYKKFFPVPEKGTLAYAAGHSLKIIDDIVNELGMPYGIKSYKPFNSTGEDFLQNYLGMIGIPMDLVTEFPEDDDIIILTEQAKADTDIVSKIEKRLLSGKDVIITSGLVHALQDREIRSIANLEYTSRKAIVKDFLLDETIVPGQKSMLIPQIQYSTNDSWEIVSGMDDELGWPLLHMCRVANATLYLLTIPENFTDLYNLPAEVLNLIREAAYKGHKYRLKAPSKVAMFTYDNNTIVLHSFNDESVEVELCFNDMHVSLINLLKDENIEGEFVPAKKCKMLPTPVRSGFKLVLPPHSFKVFRFK